VKLSSAEFHFYPRNFPIAGNHSAVARLRGFRFPARPGREKRRHVGIIFVCSTKQTLSLFLSLDRSGGGGRGGRRNLSLRKAASALSPNDSAIHKFREDGRRNDVPAAPSSGQTRYFIRAYAPDVDGRIREAVLTRHRLGSTVCREYFRRQRRDGGRGLRDLARKKRRTAGRGFILSSARDTSGRDDRVTPRRLPSRECQARALPPSPSLSLALAVSCHLSYIYFRYPGGRVPPPSQRRLRNTKVDLPEFYVSERVIVSATRP